MSPRFEGMPKELHVIDKHRRLHVVTSGGIAFNENPREPPPSGVRIVDGDGELRDNALIGTLFRDNAQPNQEEVPVPVHLRFDVHICEAGNKYQMPGDLAHISNAVKAAIAMFVPHL